MTQRMLKNWFLPLLLLLAFLGGRVADACDFSDYHVDLKKSHLEKSDNSAYDADASKRKLHVNLSFAPEEWLFLMPPAAPVPHEAVHFTSLSFVYPVSLPARAPPA